MTLCTVSLARAHVEGAPLRGQEGTHAGRTPLTMAQLRSPKAGPGLIRARRTALSHSQPSFLPPSPMSHQTGSIRGKMSHVQYFQFSSRVPGQPQDGEAGSSSSSGSGRRPTAQGSLPGDARGMRARCARDARDAHVFPSLPEPGSAPTLIRICLPIPEALSLRGLASPERAALGHRGVSPPPPGSDLPALPAPPAAGLPRQGLQARLRRGKRIYS